MRLIERLFGWHRLDCPDGPFDLPPDDCRVVVKRRDGSKRITIFLTQGGPDWQFGGRDAETPGDVVAWAYI